MKIISRFSERKIESAIAIILLIAALSGILVNLGFLFMAIANQEDLTDAIDINNELLLYVGYLSLYLSTLIDTSLSIGKLRATVFGIISTSVSFALTSITHSFALKNVYLLVFLLLIISITVRSNSLLPEHKIKPILYGLYLISFILIAIDIFNPQKIIVGWLFI